LNGRPAPSLEEGLKKPGLQFKKTPDSRQNYVTEISFKKSFFLRKKWKDFDFSLSSIRCFICTGRRGQAVLDNWPLATSSKTERLILNVTNCLFFRLKPRELVGTMRGHLRSVVTAGYTEQTLMDKKARTQKD
jgi:hypothetical protein